MSKVAAARKLAAAAAYGGGGLSVLGASLYGILRAEAMLARNRIGIVERKWPDPSGWYGTDRPGPALRIALLGDSSAVGYGMEEIKDTTGARLATGVSRAADRRVHLKSVAVSGAETSDLDAQITEVLGVEPQLAVILIGANDVTHTVRPAQSVRMLTDAVHRLRDAGVDVVVGTCPDLGTIEPLVQPLRQLARSWSRRLAAAQTIATVEAGGRTVSLGSILGPEFAERPRHLFGPDRFHPSKEGYKRLATTMLPTVLVALGVAPEETVLSAAAGHDRMYSLSDAAVEAARNEGTEVESAQVGTGRRGRWVLVRRRRRGPDLEAQDVDAEGPGSEPADEEPAT